MNVPPVGAVFLLSQVGGHAAREFANELTALKLKPHHAGILRIVSANPGMTQQTLSKTLGLFASQLVLLLDELERRDLLERRAHVRDRRSHGLHLTPLGRKAHAKIGALTDALERSLFKPLSKREITQLDTLLRRLAGAHLRPAVHPAYRDLT